VTGASRGIGKASRSHSASAACIVYVTGRTTGSGERTIDTTARLVTEGGRRRSRDRRATRQGCRHRCTLRADRQEVDQRRLPRQQRLQDPGSARLGAAASGPPHPDLGRQVGIGLRAHYVASWHAAKLLFACRARGGILKSLRPAAELPLLLSYGAGKAGLDRLTADMAIELKPKASRRSCCIRAHLDRVHPGRGQSPRDGPLAVPDPDLRRPRGRGATGGADLMAPQRHDSMGRGSRRGSSTSASGRSSAAAVPAARQTLTERRLLHALPRPSRARASPEQYASLLFDPYIRNKERERIHP